MNNLIKIRNSLIALFVLFSAQVLQGQDYIPHHYEAVSEAVGPIDGSASAVVAGSLNARNTTYDIREYVVISKVVTVSGSAAWFRLFFDDLNMGQHGFVTITSLNDGGMQTLNTSSMRIWGNTSALFNGTQVELKLYAAPNEKNIHLHINQLLVGDIINLSPETQCGPADDRVATSDGASGRIMPEGCTGWLIPNGNFLTAGHCCASLTGIDILEFNVPASTSSGVTVASSPDNQYPVNDASIVNQNVTIGDDWCVFNVGVNSNTGKTPVEKNGIIGVLDYSFFRVTHDNIPVTARVTGYGIDQVPLGTGGGYNSSSQTEQTHSGPFVSETTTSANQVALGYTVDTEGGNSGSPVFFNGTRNAVGIHTHGGCNTGGTPGNNSGTSFESDDTETAIVNSTPSNNKYVDENHPSALAATGTVFRPYKTVNAGITGAAVNDILNIAEGSYTETVVTSKSQVWKAPVGLVIIGPNAPASPVASPNSEISKINNVVQHDDIDISAVPNPVIDNCNVEIKLINDGTLQAQLNNSMGQLVKSITNDYDAKTGVKKFKVDMSDLKAGIYMLMVKTNDKTFTKKIIKM